jgi:uncharacterized Tic20 family protein
MEITAPEANESVIIRLNRKHFQTINALLLAFVTLLGAFVAWRTALAADATGDTALAGIIATINAEETHAINNITFYEHYRAYTGYTRYSLLGNEMEADLAYVTDDDEAAELEQRMRQAWATAETFYFPKRYLNRDGSYNVQRELGEAWAEAARKKDLNAEPHFAQSMRMQQKTNWLIVIITVLAVSLLAHTLAETLVGDRLKFGLMLLGALLTVGSLVALILVEFRFFV